MDDLFNSQGRLIKQKKVIDNAFPIFFLSFIIISLGNLEKDMSRR